MGRKKKKPEPPVEESELTDDQKYLIDKATQFFSSELGVKTALSLLFIYLWKEAGKDKRLLKTDIVLGTAYGFLIPDMLRGGTVSNVAALVALAGLGINFADPDWLSLQGGIANIEDWAFKTTGFIPGSGSIEATFCRRMGGEYVWDTEMKKSGCFLCDRFHDGEEIGLMMEEEFQCRKKKGIYDPCTRECRDVPEPPEPPPQD